MPLMAFENPEGHKIRFLIPVKQQRIQRMLLVSCLPKKKSKKKLLVAEEFFFTG
jgi:hypothetical protein